MMAVSLLMSELERVFSIDAAGADVSMSVWYDYDGDAQGDFSHNFSQVGAGIRSKPASGT